MPEQRAFIRDGQLYEDGEVYTASHLYSPDYYAEQNPILLVPQRKKRSTGAYTDVARRSPGTRRPRVTLWHRLHAWWERITTHYDILGEEEELHD